MSIESIIYEAMKKMLVEKKIDCVEVTGWIESYYSNSCGYGTCNYDENEVSIYYKNSKGKELYYDYSGKFGDLITELDRLS